jgi:hypothetical protein
MSWLDDTVEEGELLSQAQRIAYTAETAERPEPGAFAGAYGALGQGLVRGAFEGAGAFEALFAQASGNLAAQSLTFGDVFGPDGESVSPITEEERDAIQQKVSAIGTDTARAVLDLRPDPTTTGWASQILSEAGAVLPRTVLGALAGGPIGGAVAAGAPAGFAGKVVAEAEGIDPATATLKGVIEGATLGVGALLPAARFVRPLLGDLGIAVGANVGLGAASRGLTGQLLDSAGYTAQSAQYQAMDGQALAIDAILGAAFLGIGRAGMRRPNTEQVQAALTENNAQHFEVATAPGLPLNPKSAIAHQDALRGAIEQLNRGEPVALPESIHAAEFLRASDEVAQIVPPRAELLISARAELEPTVRAELEQRAADLLPNVRDLKTELTGIQRSLAALDDSFRARAKEFQSQGQSRKQAETSARQAIAAERAALNQRQATIDESLAANRSAEQARAELATLERGELPRGMKERINARADELAHGFQRRPLAGQVREANLTPRQRVERSAKKELDRLVAEHAASLPPETLSIPAVRAIEPEPTAAPSAAPAVRVAEPTAEPAAPGARAAAEPPEVQLLRTAIARQPNAVVRSGFDADGQPIALRADEALAELLAERDAGLREASVYDKAIACFLRL